MAFFYHGFNQIYPEMIGEELMVRTIKDKNISLFAFLKTSDGMLHPDGTGGVKRRCSDRFCRGHLHLQTGELNDQLHIFRPTIRVQISRQRNGTPQSIIFRAGRVLLHHQTKRESQEEAPR